VPEVLDRPLEPFAHHVEAHSEIADLAVRHGVVDPLEVTVAEPTGVLRQAPERRDQSPRGHESADQDHPDEHSVRGDDGDGDAGAERIRPVVVDDVDGGGLSSGRHPGNERTIGNGGVCRKGLGCGPAQNGALAVHDDDIGVVRRTGANLAQAREESDRVERLDSGVRRDGLAERDPLVEDGIRDHRHGFDGLGQVAERIVAVALAGAVPEERQQGGDRQQGQQHDGEQAETQAPPVPPA